MLQELPNDLTGVALGEACRVLVPGCKLYLAEFQESEPWVLRAQRWTCFKVFEPFGLALCDTQDRLKQLEAREGFTGERRPLFFGSLPVIVATAASAG